MTRLQFTDLNTKNMLLRLLVFLLVCLAPFSTALMAQQQNAEELKFKQHQFDFWVGKWDVYKYDTDSIVGKSHIESIIDGVAIQENYSSTRYPYKGKSLNKYNQVTGKWQQFWVDNGGLTLEIEGGIKDGKMVMGNRVEQNGQVTHNRITWAPLDDGTVRQTWDISQDEGKNWQTVFDGIYRARE